MPSNTKLTHEKRRNQSVSPNRGHFPSVTRSVMPPTPPATPPPHERRDFETGRGGVAVAPHLRESISLTSEARIQAFLTEADRTAETKLPDGTVKLTTHGQPERRSLETGRGVVIVVPSHRESFNLTSEAEIQAFRAEADRTSERKIPDSLPLQSYSHSVIGEDSVCSTTDALDIHSELSNISVGSVGSGANQHAVGSCDSSPHCQLPTKLRLVVKNPAKLEMCDIKTRDHEYGEGHPASFPRVKTSLIWSNVPMPRADRPGRKVKEGYTMCLNSKADQFPEALCKHCHGLHLHILDAVCPYLNAARVFVEENLKRTKVFWYSEVHPAKCDVIPARECPSLLSIPAMAMRVEGSTVDPSHENTDNRKYSGADWKSRLSESVTSEIKLQKFTNKADWKFVMKIMDMVKPLTTSLDMAKPLTSSE